MDSAIADYRGVYILYSATVKADFLSFDGGSKTVLFDPQWDISSQTLESDTLEWKDEFGKCANVIIMSRRSGQLRGVMLNYGLLQTAIIQNFSLRTFSHYFPAK